MIAKSNSDHFIMSCFILRFTCCNTYVSENRMHVAWCHGRICSSQTAGLMQHVYVLHTHFPRCLSPALVVTYNPIWILYEMVMGLDVSGSGGGYFSLARVLALLKGVIAEGAFCSSGLGAHCLYGRRADAPLGLQTCLPN